MLSSQCLLKADSHPSERTESMLSPFYHHRVTARQPAVCEYSIPLHPTPLQRLQQLRPLSQRLPRLLKPHPTPRPLMTLRPLPLLLHHLDLKKPIPRPGRKLPVFLDLRLRPLLLNVAQVPLDRDVDPGFFPGFARGGVCFGRFVGFPAAFGEDPAFAGGGLNEEDLVAGGGEGDYACD